MNQRSTCPLLSWMVRWKLRGGLLAFLSFAVFHFLLGKFVWIKIQVISWMDSVTENISTAYLTNQAVRVNRRVGNE